MVECNEMKKTFVCGSLITIWIFCLIYLHSTRQTLIIHKSSPRFYYLLLFDKACYKCF